MRNTLITSDYSSFYIQIEFYFSDSNYRKDKWLQNEAKKNDQGFISLAEICKFNKMKALNATDVDAVAKILEESEVVDVSDDKTMIKRKYPVPEQDDSDDRTIYFKGLPSELTLAQVEEIFAPHGTVLLITMRRNRDKSFKGTGLVEFKTKEEAEGVLAKADSIKHNDKPLLIQAKKVWEGEKDQFRNRQKDDKKELKRKAEEDKVKEDQDRRERFIEEVKARDIPQKTVLKVEGVPADASTRELRAHFDQYAKVSFVEFTPGTTEALVRFGDAFENIEKAQEGKFKEATLTMTLLTGDDLTQFWQKTWTEMFDKRQQQSHKPGGRGGRGGRGGHHHHKRQRK